MDAAEQAGQAYRATARKTWLDTHPHWPVDQPIPAVVALDIDRESRAYERGYRAGFASARTVLEAAR